MTIKVGSKVLVSSSVNANNAKCGWVPEMGSIAGKVLTVHAISSYNNNRFSIISPTDKNEYWFEIGRASCRERV